MTLFGKFERSNFDYEYSMYQLVEKDIERIKSNFNMEQSLKSLNEGKILKCHHLNQKLIDISFNQMSARKGNEMFGKKALAAIVKEYKQLDKLQVFEPLDVKTLSSQQKFSALNAIDLIKEKWCGKIKGRTVAYGHKQ